MKLEQQILINQFGQNLIENDQLLSGFSVLNLEEKRSFLRDLEFLIIQSKPNGDDIKEAIISSGLKHTYTPCVLLEKVSFPHALIKIIALPEMELNKAYKLLLSLFRGSYRRRFLMEKNNPNKWWYWDLSEARNVLNIKEGMEY